MRRNGRSKKPLVPFARYPDEISSRIGSRRFGRNTCGTVSQDRQAENELYCQHVFSPLDEHLVESNAHLASPNLYDPFLDIRDPPWLQQWIPSDGRPAQKRRFV